MFMTFTLGTRMYTFLVREATIANSSAMTVFPEPMMWKRSTLTLSSKTRRIRKSTVASWCGRMPGTDSSCPAKSLITSEFMPVYLFSTSSMNTYSTYSSVTLTTFLCLNMKASMSPPCTRTLKCAASRCRKASAGMATLPPTSTYPSLDSDSIARRCASLLATTSSATRRWKAKSGTASGVGASETCGTWYLPNHCTSRRRKA
ncbi:PP69 [Orf virus]|uniref:PP69 n=1 Tax=Orf virus TaxID=10258 RepID=F1AX72_ORFV|nr:PP69 [Orf virus]